MYRLEMERRPAASAEHRKRVKKASGPHWHAGYPPWETMLRWPVCELLQPTHRTYHQLRSAIFHTDREDCHASPARGLLSWVMPARTEASSRATQAQARFRWGT